MRFTAKVTVDMSEAQMEAWAAEKGIEPTEEAIRVSLWGSELFRPVDERFGRIVGVDVTDAALGRDGHGNPAA